MEVSKKIVKLIMIVLLIKLLVTTCIYILYECQTLYMSYNLLNIFMKMWYYFNLTNEKKTEVKY